MQNCLLLLLMTLTVSLSCRAQTCPPVNEINLANPPTGWKLLIPPPPLDEPEEYFFGKAIHSFNLGFFFKQILCIYQTADSFLAPTFELISDGTFELPYGITGAWNQPAIIAETIMCAPSNHDPSVCVFE